MRAIKNVFLEIKQRIRGEVPMSKLKKKGLVVGNGFWHGQGCTFDVSHCWLINIGNNVTLSSNVHILAHDASTQKHNGLVKIGKVNIKDNVFVGYSAIILPGVTVGENSIVAAGAVVSKDIPPNEVWGGVPAKRICSLEDYVGKNLITEKTLVYDETYTVRGKITDCKKKEMIEQLENDRIAYVK
ncbi:MAG: acyltransferase [Lachnospiraceae bacterium]|nr:acyltransferase [Lachnospiraceae bacterium]